MGTAPLQAHGGTVRPSELGAEANAEPHAEPAMPGVVEHRTRHLKVQAIIRQPRRDAGVNGHHTVAWQGLAQLRVDPLWHHGISAQCQVGLQPCLTACGQRFDFGTPGRVRVALWMHLAQGLQELLRYRFGVPHDAYHHGIVAPDLLHV